MSEFTPILLPVIAALFFFLPGMSAIFAFAGKKSTWRSDDLHFITSSTGLSLAITLLAMFTLFVISQVTHSSFQFVALPVILGVLTAAFLLIALFRSSLLRPMRGIEELDSDGKGGRA